MSMSSAVDMEGERCDQSNVFACSILYMFMFIFIFIQVGAYIRGGGSISSIPLLFIICQSNPDPDHDIMQTVPPVQEELDGTKQKEMRGVTNKSDIAIQK